MVDNCSPVRKCSSDLTGWLTGEHLTFEDSIVRREVCFHGLLNCCYRTVQIRVRECQGYFVYELNPSPTERFSRYCASARTLSSALSTRQDSINGQHALVKKTVSWTDAIGNKNQKRGNELFSCPESSIQYARICVEILTRGLVRSVCPDIRHLWCNKVSCPTWGTRGRIYKRYKKNDLCLIPC